MLMSLPCEMKLAIMELVVTPYDLEVACDQGQTNNKRHYCLKGFPEGVLSLRVACKDIKYLMDHLLPKSFGGRITLNTAVSRATIDHLAAHPLAEQVLHVWTSLGGLEESSVPASSTFVNLRSVRSTDLNAFTFRYDMMPVIGDCVHIHNLLEFRSFVGDISSERESIHLERLITLLSHLKWGSDRPWSFVDYECNEDRFGLQAGHGSLVEVGLKLVPVGFRRVRQAQNRQTSIIWSQREVEFLRPDTVSWL